MDRMHCDIVKDLLPLYVDDVCSEKSKATIEEHLKECEECRKYYESLIDKTPEVVVDGEASVIVEREFLKKIQEKITFDMVVVGFVVFLVCVIMGLTYQRYLHDPGKGFWGRIDRRLELEDITITDLYQLESGEIYFNVNSKEKFVWPYAHTMIYEEKEDIYYAEGFCTYSWWEEYVENTMPMKTVGFVYETKAKEHSSGIMREISEIRFEGKNDESIVVWKKGQKLEPAPEEIEREVKEMEEKYFGESIGTSWIYTKESFDAVK